MLVDFLKCVGDVVHGGVVEALMGEDGAGGFENFAGAEFEEYVFFGLSEDWH